MGNKCKNKKCQRDLPDGYKHRYCENCRNAKAQMAKNIGKGALSVAVAAGGIALSIITKGKLKPKGKP